MKKLLLLILLLPILAHAQVWQGVPNNLQIKINSPGDTSHRINMGSFGFWYPTSGGGGGTTTYPLTQGFGISTFSFNGSTSGIHVKADTSAMATILSLNPKIAIYGNAHYLPLTFPANQTITLSGDTLKFGTHGTFISDSTMAAVGNQGFASMLPASFRLGKNLTTWLSITGGASANTITGNPINITPKVSFAVNPELGATSTVGYVPTATNTSGDWSWTAPAGGSTGINGLNGTTNIGIGGALTSSSTIDNSNNDLLIEGNNSYVTSHLVLDPGGTYIQHTQNSNGHYGVLDLSNTGINIGASNGVSGVITQLSIGQGTAIFIDGINHKDLTAFANYGSNLTTLSYITKHEADSLYIKPGSTLYTGDGVISGLRQVKLEGASSELFIGDTSNTTGLDIHTNTARKISVDISAQNDSTYSKSADIVLSDNTIGLTSSIIGGNIMQLIMGGGPAHNRMWVYDYQQRGLLAAGDYSTFQLSNDSAYMARKAVNILIGNYAQPILSSGVNIKTINSNTLLGSGDYVTPNIGNTDLTLSGNRIISIGSNTLSFNNGVSSHAAITVGGSSSSPFALMQAVNSSLVGGFIRIDNTQALFKSTFSGGSTSSLTINTSGMTITDSWNNIGLVADATIDTASITSTPKAYVTNEWVSRRLTGGAGITALTGDVTASGSGSVAATVAQINGITKSYYDPTSSIQTQLNTKLSANQSITFTPTGDVTGSASGSTSLTPALTIGAGKITNAMLAGSITNANLLNSSTTINGTSISLGASGTVTAAASTLTGSTLSSGVTASSLTAFGSSPTLNTAVLTGLPTGTGVSNASTASTLAARDANSNLYANAFHPNFTTTVSSATPIVLTVGSAQVQEITGSTTQTVTLPVASTLTTGWTVIITSASSATITVQSSGGNTVATLVNGNTATIWCVLASGTGLASWDRSLGSGSFTGTGGSMVLATGASLTSPTITTGTFSGNQAGSFNFSGSIGVIGRLTTVSGIVQKVVNTAINTSATVTAAQLAGGGLTSTSAALVTMTLPTATSIGSTISATQGTQFYFVVDNTAGANIVTVAVGSGMTAVSAITGGTLLTVTNGQSGTFLLVFSSATVCQISRVQ